MELTPLYSKKIKCGLCAAQFETTKIRGRFVRVKEHDTDLMPVYENPEINPSLYHVHICPDCGYAFTDDSAPYFPPGAREEIDAKITKRWSGQDFSGERSISDAIKAYKLAVYTGTLKKEKSITMAGLYLRLSWLYRELGNVEQEKRFQRLAHANYQDSYSKEDYAGTQMSTERILYILAELSLRLGEEDQATRYFSKIIEKQHSSTEPKMVKMAKDRWQAHREQKQMQSS
ncbi:DUF2225 domain-containing protein [Jeotgalibacillus aurantiacus]|uniref:DUF2225 domain-containing protein n=1 Tax=Jeotgalibacillus aurantiacus TaxID=2763266 RepID=UPI001D0BB8A9|nr:DUF2225 domain-containing protein [Jeotgalibacillus aurantiacus]